MSIVTQCPGCGTTFRVTPPQLQAQHGMVRCGRCAQVFDGFKTLATLPDTTQPQAPPDNRPTAETVAMATTMVSEEPAPAPAHEAAPAALAAPTASADELSEIVQAPSAASAPPAFSPADFTVPARRRSGGWAFGSLLLVLGLAAQGAYFFRSDIAASVPEARSPLSRMCEVLRCTVALPQKPRQISIEASDMQATDPANPGVIALTATLRNHATIELGYPALDVVLTNTKEHTVARRVFLPAEYLVPGKDARSIAPNAEVTVRLDLETGDLGAAGFRLDLIAAPAR
ncbi:MAG: zinc-ribbon and DUF3426 domain-containing protein [Burkholderiales bacterium]